jgi:hypothetical protein
MLREGFDIAGCTVEWLMANLGLHGVIRGKPVRTTMQDKFTPCPLDHVNRVFHAPAPNRLWRSDFTYVNIWSGFDCVAFAIELEPVGEMPSDQAEERYCGIWKGRLSRNDSIETASRQDGAVQNTRRQARHILTSSLSAGAFHRLA